MGATTKVRRKEGRLNKETMDSGIIKKKLALKLSI